MPVPEVFNTIWLTSNGYPSEVPPSDMVKSKTAILSAGVSAMEDMATGSLMVAQAVRFPSESGTV